MPNNYFKKHRRLGFLDSIEDTKQFLEDNGYINNEIEYYSRGFYGMVFTTSKNPDKVIKITTSEEEVNNAKKLKGKNLNHVVNIHNVLPKEADSDVYVIIMERLEPIPKYIQKKFKPVDDLFVNMQDKMTKKIPEDDFKVFIDNVKNESLYNEDQRKNILRWLSNMDKYYLRFIFHAVYFDNYARTLTLRIIYELHLEDNDLFPHMIKGLLELKKQGVTMIDTHSENVLYDPKNKKYKLIDIQ